MGNKTVFEEGLKEIAFRNGATIYGVGEVKDLLASFPLLSEDLRHGMNRAISVGIRLSDKILDDIKNGPTRLYYFHYRRINQSLDHIGISMTNFIQMQGFSAVPIPASQTVDWDEQWGHISHKATGLRAGHGWIGRNNLLIHPDYGASLRYMTVLTDIPIACDEPIVGDCGPCRKCIEVCPAKAISDSFDEYDRDACLEQLKAYSKMRHIRHYICGICVRACRPHRVKANAQK